MHRAGAECAAARRSIRVVMQVDNASWGALANLEAMVLPIDADLSES
jgi:hypothetical protein